MKDKKEKKWTKLRHKIIVSIVSPFFFLYSKIKYGIKIVKFKDRRRQYLVVSNHQTAFDQFFISLLFKKPVYYFASEDLFAKGFVSKLLRYAVAPIPIKKSMTDVRAVMNSLRIRNEGGTIALFPEGNRTFSGKTEYIKPAIGGLAKMLKLPVAVVRLEGGYGVHPRWADKVRKGKMTAYVKEVIEYDEIKNLSDEDVYQRIKDAIDFNDFDITGQFIGKNNAEYVERVMYVCPVCGITKFYSEGNFTKCEKCGTILEYDNNRNLICNNQLFPFTRICDWYDYQEGFIHNFDLSGYYDKPIYSEVTSFCETKLYHKVETIYKNAKIDLYANRYEIYEGENKTVLMFDNLTAVTALGKNRLNIYIDGRILQLRSHTHFNAVVFLNIYYHYINTVKEGNNEHFGKCNAGREFLGL